MRKYVLIHSVALATLLISTSTTARDSAAPHSGMSVVYLEVPQNAKPRVVVTADPELDDLNSMIRFLLHATDVKVEGLVYASSRFHWKGDGKGTAKNLPDREYTDSCPCTSYRWSPDERFIDDVVDAYEKVYPNLMTHDRGYPSPKYLRAKIRWGNVEFDGDMSRDTPGSELIKALLLDDVQEPVYLQAWGGQSTIARALKSIQDQYSATPQWAAIRDKVVSKAIISASGDQDDTYTNYIKPVWPDIRYTRNMGGPSLGYTALDASSLEDNRFLNESWTKANVSTVGPLGQLYRVWGDGRIMVPGDKTEYYQLRGETEASLKRQGYTVAFKLQKEGSFLAEGDTGNYLNLLDNGLRGYREESSGGWAGYKVRDVAAFEARMRMFSGMSLAKMKLPFDVPRGPTNPFLAPLQNEFAARLKWSVTPSYRNANHAPVVSLDKELSISVLPSQRVQVRASTHDPDGDRVRVQWWHWKEAGTYGGVVSFTNEAGNVTTVNVPADAKRGDEIQIIAQATDDGTPTMTRYAKVVLKVH